jgi:hypothetical protein
MSHWKRLLSLIAVVGLSACGGGGSSSGTPGLGPSPSPKVADLVIVLSADSIPNTGAKTVTATITAVDSSRNGVKDVALKVSVDNNAVVSTAAAVTDATGKLDATIGIGADRTNRNITVTVVAGDVTRSTVLKVVTDPATQNPTADDLTLVLSSPSLTNGGSSTITATVTAVDRNRNVVAGIPVTISVDSSATASVNGTITTAAGTLTANIGIGADRSNRVVTVTATSGSLVRTASFSVTGARLTVSAAPLVVAGSTGNVIEYTLVDFNALAMVDQPITVTGNGLPSQSGRTDLNGKFRYTYSAPASSGTLTILAAAAGDQRSQQVTVSAATSSVAVASEIPQSASVTPTPSVVTVNTAGSSTNQVELRVLFLGANNKPIPRVRARFDLAGNANSSDGVVSWVGTYAYSDENGVARATFTPGQRSSPTNGVTIRVCYDVGDFSGGPPGNDCQGVPRTALTTLTVSSEALAVNIRTNELIKPGSTDLTYIKEYVVMVVDSAGQAKADVQITPSVDLTGNHKGYYVYNDVAGQWVQVPTLDPGERYVWTGTAWQRDSGAATGPVCPNEDINRNGVREAGLFVAGAAAPVLSARQEDLNWNGDLDPRKSDVAIKMVGSSRTNSNGLAVVQIEYGRNLASWVDFVITVTASGVSGTEARARYIGSLHGIGNLPYPSSAVTVKTVAPAFVISPYGRGTTCLDDQ